MRTIFFLMTFIVFGASAAMAQVEGAVSSDGEVMSDTQVTEVTAEYIVFGEPMPDVMEKMALAEAVKRFEELRGVEMQITGTAQPCPNEDCWVMLTDGGTRATVMLLDDRLTIPMDVTGKEITVFGMLEEHFDPAEAEQELDEGSEEPKDLHVIARSVRIMK